MFDILPILAAETSNDVLDMVTEQAGTIWQEFRTNWVLYLFLGGFAGALAKLIMPGRDPGQILGTFLIGIIGAFIGFFANQQIGRLVDSDGNRSLSEIVGLDELGGLTIQATYAELILATLGSLFLLILYRLIFGQARR